MLHRLIKFATRDFVSPTRRKGEENDSTMSTSDFTKKTRLFIWRGYHFNCELLVFGGTTINNQPRLSNPGLTVQQNVMTNDVGIGCCHFFPPIRLKHNDTGLEEQSQTRNHGHQQDMTKPCCSTNHACRAPAVLHPTQIVVLLVIEVCQKSHIHSSQFDVFRQVCSKAGTLATGKIFRLPTYHCLTYHHTIYPAEIAGCLLTAPILKMDW